MASSLRQIAELNNSGVSMLVAARDKDAFRILQNALAIMEQEMLTAPSKTSGSSHQQDSSTDNKSSTVGASTSNSSGSATMNKKAATPSLSSSSRRSTGSESSTGSSTSRSSNEDYSSSSSPSHEATAAAASPATAAASPGATTSSTATTEVPAASGTPPRDPKPTARFVIDIKQPTQIPELRDDRYFIFNQALLVDLNDANITAYDNPGGGSGNGNEDSQGTTTSTYSDGSPVLHPPPQSLVCFYTAVTIFNLALAYHKRGIVAASLPPPPPSTVQQTQSQLQGLSLASSASVPASSASLSSSSIPQQSCQRMPRRPEYAQLALSQSMRLYEHCLKIAKSIAHYSEDCKLLLYAVSCNLAHIYCRRGERSRAQELLDGLEEANRLSYMNLQHQC